MTDPVIFPRNVGNAEPDRHGVYDDFVVSQSRPADFTPGLVSLGFIKDAVWRSTRFLIVVAVIGLLAGLGLYVKSPHSYQASASVLITLSPLEDSLTEPTNNQALAETVTVAGRALHQLGLQQSASDFLATYSVESVTPRVLTVTASASSANQAVRQARAVANAFLAFRADELHSQQNLVAQSLNQQLSQAKQRISSLDGRIAQLSGQPASAALRRLQTEHASAENTLSTVEQAVASNQSSTLPALTGALKNSQLLSVTPIPLGKKKILLTYAAIGLIGGLVVGLSIVIVRALVSDRLRRRDDIAYTLDAPVKLSVAALGARHWQTFWPGRAAQRDRALRRVTTHLQGFVPRSAQRPAGLAIVAVDNAPVVARAVAALATSYASHGNQVIAADLSSGAHLAHLLGVKGPGAHPVSHNGVNFMLAVPEHDDLAPVGPRPLAMSQAGSVQVEDALIASSVSADLLLTLVTLDPAFDGDYLATWATSAVVVVSAGQSSAVKIHSVGEMIRLAGLRLDSVVLIGADKSDESLGLTPRPDEQVDVGVLGR